MEVVVPSIRHTGTWFTIGLLKSAGLKDRNLNQKREDGSVYHGHMEKETQIRPALELAKEMPCVIPFRHPYMVEESWRRREQHGYCNLETLLHDYNTLLTRFMPIGPHLLPIDAPQRQWYLDRLAVDLALPLQTNWEPVNSKKQTYTQALQDCTPSPEVRQIVEDMQDIMEPMYDAYCR